ncbi:hypothetical protein [Demequina capsici]|uniref:Uncharacterized protein n=1 Tax=Demequina capsici TaxID=3075620 RepID=A0AA96F7U8_9MICO|nr:hypothetical protein [Demequina sp. OYTSA14]WNM24997.1 hypothetical protein RN606_02275 [Demequina sp. OYTSA14]
MTAEPLRTAEFDRFGPWVDRVEVLDDLPPLYRDHPFDLASARLVLKVPRNIARRDARPDMDLYDHLLILEEDRLTVLSRHARAGARDGSGAASDGYGARVIPLGDVLAVWDTVDLLAGKLSVVVRGQAPVKVPFNGSARAQIDRLVMEIVACTASAPIRGAGGRLLAAPTGGTPAVIREALTLDKGVVADYAESAAHSERLEALAWHPRQPLEPIGVGIEGALRRLSHAILPATLQAAVIARTPSTLEVFTRHEWILRRKKPVHSSTHLIVPLAAIDSMRATPHPGYARIVDVTLAAGGAAVVLSTPQDGPTYRALSVAL